MEDSSWSSFAFLARIWQKQCQCKDSVCCRKNLLKGTFIKSIIINNRTNSIMNNNQYPSHPTTNFPHGQVPEREGWGGARICQRSPKACHKVEFFSSTGGIFLSPSGFFLSPGGNGKNLGIWSKCKNLIHLMFRFEPGKCKEEETTETSSFR